MNENIPDCDELLRKFAGIFRAPKHVQRAYMENPALHKRLSSALEGIQGSPWRPGQHAVVADTMTPGLWNPDMGLLVKPLAGHVTHSGPEGASLLEAAPHLVLPWMQSGLKKTATDMEWTRQAGGVPELASAFDFVKNKAIPGMQQAAFNFGGKAYDAVANFIKPQNPPAPGGVANAFKPKWDQTPPTKSLIGIGQSVPNFTGLSSKISNALELYKRAVELKTSVPGETPEQLATRLASGNINKQQFFQNAKQHKWNIPGVPFANTVVQNAIPRIQKNPQPYLESLKKVPKERVVDVISKNPGAFKMVNNSNTVQPKIAGDRPGLWDNIRAKRARGEKPAKPGDKEYPDKKQWKRLTSKTAELLKIAAKKLHSSKTIGMHAQNLDNQGLDHANLAYYEDNSSLPKFKNINQDLDAIQNLSSGASEVSFKRNGGWVWDEAEGKVKKLGKYPRGGSASLKVYKNKYLLEVIANEKDVAGRKGFPYLLGEWKRGDLNRLKKTSVQELENFMRRIGMSMDLKRHKEVESLFEALEKKVKFNRMRNGLLGTGALALGGGALALFANNKNKKAEPAESIKLADVKFKGKAPVGKRVGRQLKSDRYGLALLLGAGIGGVSGFADATLTKHQLEQSKKRSKSEKRKKQIDKELEQISIPATTLGGAAMGAGLGGYMQGNSLKFNKKMRSSTRDFNNYFRRHEQTHGSGSWGRGWERFRREPPRASVDKAKKYFNIEKVKTKDEAKNVYRDLVKKHHPDRGGDEHAMKEINNHWDQIKDSDWFQKLAFEKLAAMRRSILGAPRHVQRAYLENPALHKRMSSAGGKAPKAKKKTPTSKPLKQTNFDETLDAAPYEEGLKMFQEGKNRIKRADVIKFAKSKILQDLLEAKKMSDNRDFVHKNELLRKLVTEHPKQFKVDSHLNNSYVGLTHKPTGFKIHAQKKIIPSELLTEQ